MSEASDFEWDKFEAAVQFLKKGIDTLLFRDAIKAATGHEILPFNGGSLLAVDLVDTWIKNNLSTLSTLSIRDLQVGPMN